MYEMQRMQLGQKCICSQSFIIHFGVKMISAFAAPVVSGWTERNYSKR
jgi:hypothetical protein